LGGTGRSNASTFFPFVPEYKENAESGINIKKGDKSMSERGTQKKKWRCGDIKRKISDARRCIKFQDEEFKKEIVLETPLASPTGVTHRT
jgi:hypothetical protein